MEAENSSEKVMIGIKIPYDMFEELQSVAQSEFNSIAGITKKFISEGLANYEQRKAIQQ